MSTITQEQLQAAYTQWTTDLNLTEEQKEKFHAAVDKTVARLNEKAANGETVDADAAKATLRVAVEKWLTPDQLIVWDRGVDSVKSYLGLSA